MDTLEQLEEVLSKLKDTIAKSNSYAKLLDKVEYRNWRMFVAGPLTDVETYIRRRVAEKAHQHDASGH